MTHRSDIIWPHIKLTVEDIGKLPEEKLHTIYPVCDGNIDKIKGIVSLKDIVKAKPGTKLDKVMTPALYVPKIIPLINCLKDSRS